MDGITMVTAFLGVFMMFVYGIIATKILSRARKENKKNMIYFSIVLYGAAVLMILAIVENPIVSLIAYTVLTFSDIMFVKLTFYNDKKSLFKQFLAIGLIEVIIGVITVIFSVLYDSGFLVMKSTHSAIFILSTLWKLYATTGALKDLEGYELEPYVRKKYIIYGRTMLLTIVIGVMVLINDFLTGSISDIMLIIISLFGTVASVMNYLIWIFPTYFKNFLNKGFTISGEISKEETELTEEEIMESLMR
jgi:hypothetical protein